VVLRPRSSAKYFQFVQGGMPLSNLYEAMIGCNTHLSVIFGCRFLMTYISIIISKASFQLHNAFVTIVLNLIVHVLMYNHYFRTASGAKIWWKKITYNKKQAASTARIGQPSTFKKSKKTKKFISVSNGSENIYLLCFSHQCFTNI
ncbi:hypothetical protein K501DRAFT_280066, partial [Backusella circina FSU 941]